MRKLLPVILALVGLGAGVGAGLALKPPPEVAADGAGEVPGAGAAEGAGEGHAATAEAGHDATAPETADATAGKTAGGHGEDGDAVDEFVKLNNQFVVPVVAGGKVGALVVLSVSLQVDAGAREEVFAREPKLRDGFLQVLFDHANSGGFDGVFTSAANLRTLRLALLEAAQSVLGPAVRDVLITDMMRQDG